MKTVFKNTSISGHCLCLVTEAEFKEFVEGTSMFLTWYEGLRSIDYIYHSLLSDDFYVEWSSNYGELTKEQLGGIIKKFKKSGTGKMKDEFRMICEWLYDTGHRTYNDYFGEYEPFEKHATFGKEDIVAFGYHGIN